MNLLENSNPLPPGHGHLREHRLYVLFTSGDAARRKHTVIVELCFERPHTAHMFCGTCYRNTPLDMSPIPDRLLRRLSGDARVTNGFESRNRAVDTALLAELDLAEDLGER